MKTREGDYDWVRLGRFAGWALVGAGGLFLALTLTGVWRAAALWNELAFLATGGIGGVFCIGMGISMLAAAEIADAGRRMDDIERSLLEADPRSGPGANRTIQVNGSASVPAPFGERVPAPMTLNDELSLTVAWPPR